MGKPKQSPEANPGDPAPVKKKKGKPSYFSRLAPFIERITAWANDQYANGRFDKDVTDEELDSRDKLRKVLADFPEKG